jgi:hypothetical protein
VLKEFGGKAFVKLNWSAPKVRLQQNLGRRVTQHRAPCFQDAKWVNFAGNLRCQSVGDVLLLLKSSDFIAHDLTHA